jgi:hypothetical protein
MYLTQDEIYSVPNWLDLAYCRCPNGEKRTSDFLGLLSNWQCCSRLVLALCKRIFTGSLKTQMTVILLGDVLDPTKVLPHLGTDTPITEFLNHWVLAWDLTMTWNLNQ